MKKICILLSILLSAAGISAQTTRPVISDINAIPKNEKNVKITWNLPKYVSPEIKGIIVYRDSKQIISSNQLLTLKPVAKLNADTTEFIDSLRDNREYYYSIICTTDNGNYNVILPSVNTTVSGVRVSSAPIKEDEVITPENIDNKFNSQKSYDASEKMRDIPLPTPGLVESTKKGQNILGPKAMAQAKELGKKYTGNSNRITKLFIFENDMVSPEGGDDYYLFKILKYSFVKKDFAKSTEELTDFLSIHRNKEVTERAIFYLGESYYFSKNYEKAVFQFLQVQDTYPELAKKWIDSSLDLINLK